MASASNQAGERWMRPQMSERRTDIAESLISAMVVDDDDAVRGAIADTLRDSGYRVAEASSGEGAVRRLERITPPTVLVSDVNLGPGMSGLELAATVRKLWPATGILLVSADPRPFAGSEEFLSKPFSTDCFLTRIATIADRMRPPVGSGIF